MANTTYFDVVEVFKATFTEKVILDSSLIHKWFDMALEEFDVEIEPLTYDEENEFFIYLDKNGNEIALPRLYVNILGYTIKKYYCERESDKINKRTNIIGKDLKINNTDADKKHIENELTYVVDKISEYYGKLKDTAWS